LSIDHPGYSTRTLQAAGLAWLLAVLPGCGGGSSGGDASSSPAPPVTSEWPMYGHDTAHTGVSEENAFTAANVGALAPQWQQDLGTSGSPPAGSPTVADGRVFAGSSVGQGDNFFAFDVATGAQLWSADLDRRVGNCGPFSEIGIPSTAAVSGSTLVVGGGNAAYYALDTATGRILWKHSVAEPGPSAYAWESPLIRGDRVYVGIAAQCDNPSVRGEMRALSLTDGSLLARRYFAPEGSRGGGIWHSPALSADGNTLFITTGEDDQRDEEPYQQAMVALDPVSLEIRQTYRIGASGGDTDFGSSPILFHDAAQRSLIGAASKDGCFYAFDATALPSGPVWQTCIKPDIGVLGAYDSSSGPGGLLLLPTFDRSVRIPQLHFLDPATGADRLPPVTTSYPHGHLTVAGGLVFLNVGAEGVQVFDEATGAALRTLVPAGAGKAYSGPVVASGRVFWLSGSTLNAWALP
jgi:outer membrane protein assembly factor BamB